MIAQREHQAGRRDIFMTRPVNGAARTRDEGNACYRTLGLRLAHDLRRSAVRNLERAGILRSVAMKTEAVCRRYAIVAENDPREAGAKLAMTLGRGTAAASLGDNLGDYPMTAQNGRSANH